MNPELKKTRNHLLKYSGKNHTSKMEMNLENIVKEGKVLLYEWEKEHKNNKEISLDEYQKFENAIESLMSQSSICFLKNLNANDKYNFLRREKDDLIYSVMLFDKYSILSLIKDDENINTVRGSILSVNDQGKITFYKPYSATATRQILPAEEVKILMHHLDLQPSMLANPNIFSLKELSLFSVEKLIEQEKLSKDRAPEILPKESMDDIQEIAKARDSNKPKT